MQQEPKPILTISDWLERVQELETTFQHPQYWPQLPNGCQLCGLGSEGQATGLVCNNPKCPTRITAT